MGDGDREHEREDAEEPKAQTADEPGGSKMESLERIERSLERQSEETDDARSKDDARTPDPDAEADSTRDSGE